MERLLERFPGVFREREGVEPPRFGPRPDFHSFREPKSGAVRPKVPCKEEYFLTKTKTRKGAKHQNIKVFVAKPAIKGR